MITSLIKAVRAYVNDPTSELYDKMVAELKRAEAFPQPEPEPVKPKVLFEVGKKYKGADGEALVTYWDDERQEVHYEREGRPGRRTVERFRDGFT